MIRAYLSEQIPAASAWPRRLRGRRPTATTRPAVAAVPADAGSAKAWCSSTTTTSVAGGLAGARRARRLAELPRPFRAAGLQRRPREVQPDIAAAHQPGADIEVVIVEEHHALADDARVLEAEQRLQRALSLVVSRMRLARHEHDLHRAVAAKQRHRPFGIAHQQLEPLVGRHAASEANRQDLRDRTRRAAASTYSREIAARRPIVGAALVDEVDQL